jgi:hypothetical protein
LIARYEELRRQALGPFGSQTQGLALFLQRGMSAWMQAWSQCVAPQTSPAQPPQTQEICPVQLHADVATLLASMILFARQEVIA